MINREINNMPVHPQEHGPNKNEIVKRPTKAQIAEKARELLLGIMASNPSAEIRDIELYDLRHRLEGLISVAEKLEVDQEEGAPPLEMSAEDLAYEGQAIEEIDKNYHGYESEDLYDLQKLIPTDSARPELTYPIITQISSILSTEHPMGEKDAVSTLRRIELVARIIFGEENIPQDKLNQAVDVYNQNIAKYGMNMSGDIAKRIYDALK